MDSYRGEMILLNYNAIMIVFESFIFTNCM